MYEKKVVSLDRPAWEPPKIRAVETLLEEHKILTTSLCNNTITDANIEPAIRNIIILAQAIDRRIGPVMDEFEHHVEIERAKLSDPNLDKNSVNRVAYNRALIAIEGKALGAISKFIQGEGSEMKIAIVREKQYDKNGKPFLLMEDTEADKFLADHNGVTTDDVQPC
jgi:hypothetical protein